MSQLQNGKQIFSLREVTLSIQKTIRERYTSTFWVKAEMNKLNYYPHSGHCYPDLVEKTEGRTIATLRASLWKNDYLAIDKKFRTVLKEPLKDGIKILFLASINFDPIHGLHLQILDIDPSFSLGELEREKQETIARLQQEGIFHLNKQLTFPLLAKRIAVISVETSKGYADYLKVLTENSWGYKYFNMLFPALLQGDRAVVSILLQLARIRIVAHQFHAVAIIRGGGGDIGLSAFNNYDVAKAIAEFPIPVLTGIGHSTNETVAELVAHRNAITPTELADVLLHNFHDYAEPIEHAEKLVSDFATDLLTTEKSKFDHQLKYFNVITRNALQRNHNIVEKLSTNVAHISKRRIVDLRYEMEEVTGQLQEHCRQTLRNAGTGLKQMEGAVRMLDPINVMKRGFTITRINGKTVTSVQQVVAGDILTTEVIDGVLSSELKEKTKFEANGE